MHGLLRTWNNPCDFSLQREVAQDRNFPSDTQSVSAWGCPPLPPEGEKTSMPAPLASSYQQLPVTAPHTTLPAVACWGGPRSHLRSPFSIPVSCLSL